MKVAVIGCGVMGSCTTRALALRGHEVTAFEQFELGHAHGSSHGESRIVRKAYPDGFYTELLLEGYPMWHEIQKESNRQLLYEVGLLYLFQQDHPELKSQVAALSELDVPHELKRSGETQLILEKDDVGVFTPEAGWVHVPTVLETVRKTAANHGVKFVHRKIESLEELSNFDRVVVTAGAWVHDFAPVPVTPRKATFAYIEGTYEGPVFIDSYNRSVYGFPNEPGRSVFKAGSHDVLPEMDPDAPSTPPDEEGLEAIRDFCRRRLAISSPKLVEPTTCIYTQEANEDFKIAMINDRTVVASPCSGHGFKFGPWIGKLLADVCEGKADLKQWPRFSF